MDDQVTFRPAMVSAGSYQFGSSETLRNASVQSRCLVWRIAGDGAVDVGGTSYVLDVGDTLVLPWDHEIAYRASASDPFLIAAVHLVPEHRTTVAVTFRAAHGVSDALRDSSERRPSLNEPRRPELIRGGTHPRLEGALALTLSSWGRELRSKDASFALGAIICEMLHHGAERQTSLTSLPVFTAIHRYVHDHLVAIRTLEDVAGPLRISASTCQRNVRAATGRPFTAWLRTMRVDRAIELIATTKMPIESVARAVGVSDAKYLARIIKQTTGRTPRTFRGLARLV